MPGAKETEEARSRFRASFGTLVHVKSRFCTRLALQKSGMRLPRRVTMDPKARGT